EVCRRDLPCAPPRSSWGRATLRSERRSARLARDCRPPSISVKERVSMQTVILLTVSNVFMTFAWYGHLKYKESPIWQAVLASWLIAFVEYCFQVPANRIGHAYFSAPQLKVMQEVITLVVFAVFSVLYLQEQLRWNHVVGFVLIVAAVAFVFLGNPE